MTSVEVDVRRCLDPKADGGLGQPPAASTPLPKREGRRWFVVHTQPKNELRAFANLANQGFQTFYPRMRRAIRHARKTEISLAPLFPNYIFVELNRQTDRWRSINGTRGVVRLITNGDEPIPLPEGVVEHFKLRADAEGVGDWAVPMNVGDCVMISDGPFAELVGTLEFLDNSGRVQVLLDLLGRSVRVSVPSSAVSLA